MNTDIPEGPSGARMPVSAAHVLKSIVKKTDKSFYSYLQPVSACLHNGLPFSGNGLEFHFNRFDNWFDYTFRINRPFDAPLLKQPLRFRGIDDTIRWGYEQFLSPSKEGFLFGIENVWFEYDLPACASPSLFIDLHRNESFCPDTTFLSLQHIARGFNYAVHNNLLSFLHHLHDNELRAVYYGLLLSRAAKPVRLTIEGMTPAQLSAALTAIGWKGNYQRLDQLQNTWLPHARKIVVGIDYHDGPGSRLGIEVFSDQPALLTAAIRDGMTPQQYAFLQSWEGVQAIDPVLRNHLTGLHQREITHLHKRINHFKFVLDDNRISTKAYLYYCF